mgnify:CR=1 FL=1
MKKLCVDVKIDETNVGVTFFTEGNDTLCAFNCESSCSDARSEVMPLEGGSTCEVVYKVGYQSCLVIGVRNYDYDDVLVTTDVHAKCRLVMVLGDKDDPKGYDETPVLDQLVGSPLTFNVRVEKLPTTTVA